MRAIVHAAARVALTLCGALALVATARAETFTDAAGRTVELPGEISRVFAAGHPAAVLLYTLAPETLLGWSRPQPAAAAHYMPEAYFSLPELGRLTGRGGSANVEVVLAARPDLILDYGAVNPTFTSLADRVQAQTGIPYVLLNGALEGLPESYRALGRILGREARAERLAAYAQGVLEELARLRAQVGDAGPRVYYARGPDGLETGLAGAINVELLERVGAVNVAQGPGRGLANVSFEQVLAWDPQVIVTIDRQFYAEVFTSPRWSQLGAVRAGRVYLAPELPFPWFDRPPSANRLIGALWLARLLYPDSAQGLLEQQVSEFYALFYHHEPSAAQLEALLRTARGARR